MSVRGALNYAEGWFAEQDATEASETITLEGWQMQRRCPHLKADLSRFGTVEDDASEGAVMTCQMHGWKWRLSDGKCLSSIGHDLRCAPDGEPVPAGSTAPAAHDEHHGHHDAESVDG